MRQFVRLVVLGFLVSASSSVTAQYVLPPGYTQLMCTAEHRDLKVRYAIFQTKTVDLAVLDWRAFVTQFGRPYNPECKSYPDWNSANLAIKAREAASTRWGFEPLAWSPNSERLTTRQDWIDQIVDTPLDLGASPSREAPKAPRPTSPAEPKGPTPNQLKYQRELEAYHARLAEIEKIKTDISAKHSADTAAAQQRLAQHEGDMARHRAQVAQANALQRQYEQELAAHQARVSSTETKQDREAKVDWKEAVVVCSLNASDGQSRFGNWRCEGPLQMTYAKLGGAGEAPSTQAIVALSQACGGSREAIRDLGMVGSDRLFGCSFGIHPKSLDASSKDMAAKHGIAYVPGRATYRCPTYKSACRTQ